MALSAALLDTVDARIKAQRQGLPLPTFEPTPDAQPAPYVVRGVMRVADGGKDDIFERINADIKARQEAAAEAFDAKYGSFATPLPDYVVRGADKPPVADLVAQSQHQVQALRQPEWWTENVIGGAAMIGDWLVNLPTNDGYAGMIARDPIYRELRRSALFHKLRNSLDDAAALAKAGKESQALGRLQHADIYKRQIEALDGGKWEQSY